MDMVPALKLSPIERLDAAKDALLLEHRTFAHNLNDVQEQFRISLRNQMGREEVFQQIICIQYECEQNKLANLKTKSAQTKSLDDCFLLEKQVASLSTSIERMQQEKYDSRLRHKALEKCAMLHQRMLNVIGNMHNPVVLADYLQNASGSTTPVCDFGESNGTSAIFDKVVETSKTTGTSNGDSAVVNAVDDDEWKDTETTTNTHCNESNSKGPQNEVNEVINISDSSDDEAAGMPPITKRRQSVNDSSLKKAKDDRRSLQDHHKTKRPHNRHRNRQQNDRWFR